MDRPERTNKGWAAAGTLCCCLLAGGGEAGVTLDGSLGTAGPLAGPNYLIPASVGRRLGGNLFHSFDSFSIGKGESATFTGPVAVNNIISRVTGGAASNINGMLMSEIAGANLYLINPAGVVFGPDAKLDIGGAFHASTADYLGLGKTGRFDARTPADSVLTSAPPASFGFLGAKPAPISVNDSYLWVSPGQGITLIGGDISVKNGAYLFVEGGHINVAALGSSGVVEFGADPADLRVHQTGELGALRVDAGVLDTRGEGGGTVNIRAGRFVLRNGALIQASASGNGDARNISIVSDTILLESGASIKTESFGKGRGGTIRLTGKSLRVADQAYLSATAWGEGDGGDIILNADDIVFERGGEAIAWASAGTGAGGDIVIHARNLSLVGFEVTPSPYESDFTGLDASSKDHSTGRAGSIHITASEKISLANRAVLVASSEGAGQAGAIEIETPALELRSGGQIASLNIGTGAGGDVRIIADDVLLEGVHPQAYMNDLRGSMLATSGIGVQTLGLAPAGQVDIQAGRLHILDGARISVETFGASQGGNVSIAADEVLIAGRNAAHHAFLLDQGKSPETADEMSRSQINAGSRSLLVASPSGDGGDVAITTDRLVVTDRGMILSNSAGAGSGGGVNIDAREVLIGDGGMITAQGTGAGPAGSLSITAGERFSNTGGLVSTESESGGGGGIIFRVGELFHLADGAVTTSVRGGGGDAGNIDIDPRFVVLNNGHIAANAHGGAGGNIRIVSDYFLTSGASVVEASSALGVDGSVRIESVETQVTDGLEGPRAEYLDASALLRSRCAARAPGQASTFTVSGRGGLPPDPDRPAWSTYSGVIDPADKPDAGRDSAESRVEPRAELRADAACRG